MCWKTAPWSSPADGRNSTSVATGASGRCARRIGWWRRLAVRRLFCAIYESFADFRALIFESFEQSARPDKLDRQQAEPEEDHEPTRTGSHQHRDAKDDDGKSDHRDDQASALSDRFEKYRMH